MSVDDGPVVDRTKEEIAAEVKKTEAEASKALAEARKAEAEAENAEYKARVGKLACQMAEEEEERQRSQDCYHHRYNFTGPVDKASVNKCISELTYWSRKEPGCPIELVINSPGGSVIDGMALWDFLHQLKNKNHRITTLCVGMAASMAGILLQAGDERKMGAESFILIHEIAFGAMGKIGEIEDTVEFAHKMTDRILAILAKRSKMSKQAIAKKWARKDWWLDSDEALKLGFVDKVV